MKRLLLLAAAALLTTPAWSNTLVSNVNGIQVGPDGKLDHFHALIVDDDGKVAQVLHANDDSLLPYSKRVDGGGRTLLPGLIDAHGHVIESPGGSVGLGLLLLQLDVSGTQSLAEVQERLKLYAAQNPGTGWIVGRGWNQEAWPNKAFPTAADLDAVVADRPVWLVRVDGHAAVGNSAALRAAGITSQTAVPAGGRIETDANGRPTGLLVDNAIRLVADVLPPPAPAMLDRALEAAQDQLLSLGITATTDMGTSAPSWAAMERLGTAGRLRMRIMSYSNGLEPLKHMGANGPRTALFGDRLSLSGVKLYADGALGSRGAWLKQPYADKPDTRGLRFLTDAQLRQQAGTAAAAGLQLAIHAIGDAANSQVITAYEELSRRYGSNRRWRIEHFQVADPADIGRLAPAGIIASMQPTHQTSDRLMAEKRLGPDRLDGAYAWQSVLKSGARIAFGSDYPVESPNPFPGLSAAISRQDIDGQPPGGWIPSERLTFEQALDAFTRGAAYASFAEGRIGALEPGKWADFILVDRDVSKVDPQSLARTQVLETWIGGKKVWERGTSAGERGR